MIVVVATKPSKRGDIPPYMSRKKEQDKACDAVEQMIPKQSYKPCLRWGFCSPRVADPAQLVFGSVPVQSWMFLGDAVRLGLQLKGSPRMT